MKLIYSREAREKIRRLPPEIKKGIRDLLETLLETPDSGKPLERELTGFWSIRHQRHRIIYRKSLDGKAIEIVTVGHRERIYEEMSRSMAEKG